MTVSARGVCSVLDGSHGSVSPWCVQCPWMVLMTVSVRGVCSVLDGSHGSVSPWCVQCPGWFS